jgi:thiol-disulfide isomerase/thioredoxin
MERRLLFTALTVVIVAAIIAAGVWTLPTREGPGRPDLARDGAFGFPQAEATVLYDSPDYRVSLYNDDRYLYLQAVLWHDGDDTLGTTQDGRAIGDRTYVYVDIDGNGAVTPNLDRVYFLNMWPHRPGLRYQVQLGNDQRTHPRDDSAGRAAIRYVQAGDGALVRVDSIVIPLAELGRTPGESLRFAMWSRSEVPDQTFNSIGVAEPSGIGGRDLPWASYHVATLLAGRPALDPSRVPRGRDDVQDAARKPLPKVGTAPPELSAADWINADGPLTLAGLRGQVVLVDFWSTSCGDCMRTIPHLNQLQERFGPRGFKVVAFAANTREGIEWFMKEKQPIAYPVGTGSDLKTAYGVRNVPYAFLVGRDGTLLWHGAPVVSDLEQRINAALGPE